MNAKLMRTIAINMYLIEKSKLGDKRYTPRYPRYANNRNLIKTYKITYGKPKQSFL